MAVDIVIPAAGESVTSGVVLRWTKNIGDFVRRDETVLEVETDKVTMEVPSPSAGVLLAQRVKEGDTVTIGQAVGSLDESAKAPAAAAPVAAETPGSSPARAGVMPEPDVRATPLAKKTAEMLHVDLAKVAATGPGGRVREADVLVAARPGASNGSAPTPTPTPTPTTTPTPAPAPAPTAHAAAGPATREPMSPIRTRIAQRLVQAQRTAAMLTTFNECDMSAVMSLRKAYKDDFEKRHGVGLGFMGFFVKAAVSALKAFPLVNASIVEDQGRMFIERHGSCDIAVAVSTPKGLVVPVLRGCEGLGVAQIESGIKDLATRGRDGKLTLEEMQGGTFTITNGGVFGSLMSTPILNPPQSAILGMHAIKNRPVEHPAGSGQVAVRPMMYLALSYDHRIVDGAEAVQFLVKIKQAIEDPQRLLLEV